MSAECRVSRMRRDLLLAGGRLVVLAALPGSARALSARRAEHARKVVGSLSALRADAPVVFDYPAAGFRNLLVRLPVPAAGGVGPDARVVAFSLRCTHLGGDLNGTLQSGLALLGPCPRHLTTFDLLRHGRVVTGHATESLPQVVLEVEGDALVAVAIQGLVYGEDEA